VVSAKDPASIDLLVQVIREKVFKNYVTATFLIPFEKGDIVSYLNDHASVKSTDYLANGTKITAEVTSVDYQRFEQYVLEQ